MSDARDPVAILTRYHAAINAFDFTAIANMLSEDAVYDSPGVGSLSGKQDILRAFRAYFADYPDQVAVDDLIEALSPTVARAQWRLSATHAKTGAPLVRRGVETVEIDGSGLIVRVVVTDG